MTFELPFGAPAADDAAAPASGGDRKPVLLCLSHLRWQSVLQRPQHLMMRFAQRYRVIF